MLLPLNYLVNSSSVGSRSQLADSSLHVLLVLVHYRKCVVGDEIMTDEISNGAASDSNLKQTTCFSNNPYCKALENAADIECKILVTHLKVCESIYKAFPCLQLTV